jgi:hypothetical protein
VISNTTRLAYKFPESSRLTESAVASKLKPVESEAIMRSVTSDSSSWRSTVFMFMTGVAIRVVVLNERLCIGSGAHDITLSLNNSFTSPVHIDPAAFLH